MRKLLLLLGLFCLLSSISAIAQDDELFQYFDGFNTDPYNSIIINFDTAANNLWQVGPPQKILFDSAFTEPNVLITDTVQFLPLDNISRFTFRLESEYWSYGILAIQWLQKFDYEDDDGAIVEYSIDSIQWMNVYDDPYVYAYYGFEEGYMSTLGNGQVGFSGTDTTWHDVWLCFDVNWMWTDVYNLYLRYTSFTDSITNSDPSQLGKEGWMIDNLQSHITIQHTVNEAPSAEYMRIFPTVTNDRVYIETQKQNEYHIIEHIRVYDMNGKLLKELRNCPTKFWISLADLPVGMLLIEVKTNLETTTQKVMHE